MGNALTKKKKETRKKSTELNDSCRLENIIWIIICGYRREGRMGLVMHSDTGQIKLLMATYRKFAPAA